MSERSRDAAGARRADPPWIFRTYAGHSSARASNELFRRNLAAGQTGLSIAFDLPTQCGYDPDHPLARPEVGKVGVPIASLDDMHALFDQIPIEQMNTSMTINGTAMWLLALDDAIGVLDRVRARGRVDAAAFAQCVGRMSFFVNAGMRFVEELCKMRAFAQLWDELCRERYGVEDARLRQFRYGVQVNSLGLTEQQPENNAWRILIEALGVTLSRDARCRAMQLPTWNEALSLPRPWDQQWSLRLQQILAYETDLLEYGDLFAGSPVVAAKVAELCGAARAELAEIDGMGGIRGAIETGYCKRELVRSMAQRMARIEKGE